MPSCNVHHQATHPQESINWMFELQQFALEQVQESIFFVNNDARVTYANLLACSSLGYSSEELLKMSVLDIDAKFTPQIWHAHWKELKKHKQLTITTTHRKKDGTLIPVEINAKYFEYNGLGFNMAFVKDISEREKFIQSEKNLHETTTKLEALIATMPDMIWMKDLHGIYLMCNSQFEHFFATSRKNIIGKTDYDFFTHENADVCVATDKEAIAAGVLCISEETIFNPEDNTETILEVRKAPIYHTDGSMLGVLGVGRDISERYKQQELLRAREQEFRTIAEHTPDTIARYDAQCIRTYVNPAFIKLSGKSPEELLGKKPTDYYCTVQTIAYEEAILHVFHSTKEEEIEYTWPDASGSMITSLIHIVPEKDINGNVQSVLATGRNITKLKKIEEQLIQQNRFLESLLNAIPVPIFLKDKNTRYRGFNKAFEEFYGKKKEELIGKDAFDIFSHEQAQMFFDADMELFSKGGTQIYEAQLQDARGNNHTVMFHKAVYHDEAGAVNGQIGTILDITERKAIEKKIEYMAHHDALTGLPNRILAQDRMERSIAYAKRNKKLSALLFIDLDGFKTINDTLGHSTGDTVLQSVAQRLKGCIPETDTLSRQGGDEFLLILSDIKTKDDIKTVCEKLIHAFDQPFYALDNPLLVSASIGIAIYPEHGTTFETLQQSADTAMYKAKESGKNTYMYYSQQMNHNQINQFKLQNDLKKAIHNKEFILHYQPQISLAQNSINGAEALIRWKHPELGMIPPMQFIPIAESSGLIVQIGQWVIEEACRQVALWHQNGMPISVAVNISGVQLRRGNLEKIVLDALTSSKVDPKYLEVELTESIMMHDIQSTLKTIDALKALGIQLSIDDFGTGYSSLSYLKRFAVDKLKIDQSFVRDILQDREDAIIVKTIVQMASSLNLKTIAEGVEDANVLAVINAYGCDEVQGYHFAKPMEALDFQTFYSEFSFFK